MNDQLLDYVLGRLDAPAKSQVDARLQTDAGLRQRLELLRRAVAPLAADQEIVPPPNLAAWTIARVAEHACREMPHAPEALRFDSAGRSWWRRADVLVAAGLLTFFVGIGLPVLLRMRSQGSAAAIVECQNNLRLFHVGLKSYEDQHKKLPELPESPRNVAGMIVPLLQDARVLPATFSVRCPAHGPMLACNFTVDELNAMSPEQFARHAPGLLFSYAYTLGYRDENNVWHRVSRNEDMPDNAILILADNPPPAIQMGNSSNHSGLGQNVLFLDGSVQFMKRRSIARDDIYLNHRNVVASGVDPHDNVVGPSGSPP